MHTSMLSGRRVGQRRQADRSGGHGLGGDNEEDNLEGSKFFPFVIFFSLIVQTCKAKSI
jgi:hypothetical protein